VASEFHDALIYNSFILRVFHEQAWKRQIISATEKSFKVTPKTPPEPPWKPFPVLNTHPKTTVDKVDKKEDVSAVWRETLEILKSHVSPDSLQRWFAAVEPESVDEEKISLLVPNNIYQLWIETNYLALLQNIIADVVGSPRAIAFRIKGDADCHVHHPAPAKIQQPAAETRAGNVGAMSPRYTFELFVVGPNNQFAHAASLAVAQSPAKTYNPLFIYGGVGLGKTHLMQAIGQFVAVHKKNPKVVYISSEHFTNEFIDAIQNHTVVKFRKRYRQVDVLLIDDIQFLAGKERSQEEFFHTFNTLFNGHKQIVLSSDRPPAEIANLEDRLVSRFEWGLTAELQPPDIETRLAILRKKAEVLHIKIDNDILEFLAERIRSNVRRLEGALMRVASFASLSGRLLNISTCDLPT
jgi:chromosomal replication initiator protein